MFNKRKVIFKNEFGKIYGEYIYNNPMSEEEREDLKLFLELNYAAYPDGFAEVIKFQG